MTKTSRRAKAGGPAEGAPPKRAEKYEQVFEKIYRLVLRIPPGRVMTYGQIARLLEDRYSPRLVGWAMHATPQDSRNIPWHRVINSQGGISTGRVIIQEPQLQRWMLEAEGVVFDERGHCDLGVYQWSPTKNRSRAKNGAAAGLKPSRGGRAADGEAKKKAASVKQAARSPKKRKQLKKDSSWK
ncbi:MAG TPA: MGMT family protein [Blastocatellia bacterium]|jgi:methylated-DNA-protein-cysteine methyltransferase-like protein